MADKKNHIVDELAAEFLSEIREDLSSLEPDLLAMEEKGSGVDTDLINHAFRAIHSIKGGAGFIDFTQMACLANAMENVFMHVREGKLIITSDIMDALLSGFDKMKVLVDSIHSDQQVDVTDEQQRLEKILDHRDDQKENTIVTSAQLTAHQRPDLPSTGSGQDSDVEILIAAEADPVLREHVFRVEKAMLDQALQQHRFIFAVCIHPEKDLKRRAKNRARILDDIRNMGVLLFSGPMNFPAAVDSHISFQTGDVLVLATILDKVLLAEVLEMDMSRIVRLEKESVMSDVPPPVSDGIEKSGLPVPKIRVRDSVRINLDLVSSLMNRAGELVLMRNQLKPYLQKLLPQNHILDSMLQNLDMVTTDIHESVMQMRMQPISDLLGKYKRVVRDIARKLSKEVAYSYTGGDVELDRNVLENLANPFIHLIRNCVDHGIEPTDQRIRAKKPKTGQILIHACHLGGHVHITISDDGAGIHPDDIAKKAHEKKLIGSDQIKNLSDQEKINLIFLPGFSMSDEITDISGRGVGLDVVKTNIAKLNGSVDIESIPGKGTTIKLVIPLTLSIIPALITGCGQLRFAVPQISIREVLFAEPGQMSSQVNNIGGSEVLRLREHFIPVVRLRNILGIETCIKDLKTKESFPERRRRIADRRSEYAAGETRDKQNRQSERRSTHWDATYIIILKMGQDLFGLCVDEVCDIEEIVVEPLPDPVRMCRCFSGVTILGNGNIIMILDVPGLALASNLSFEAVKQAVSSVSRPYSSVKRPMDLLVFSSARNEFFAVELSQISRIEAIRPSEIHTFGRKKTLGRGKMVFPVFSLDQVLPVSLFDENDSEDVYLVIPKYAKTRIGILASSIIDIFQAELEYQEDSQCGEMMNRRIMLDDRMVQILDMETVLNMIESKTA